MAKQNFWAKVKKAPKKELTLACVCFGGAIAMFVWFLTMLF